MKMLHSPVGPSGPRWGTVGQAEAKPDTRERVLTEVRLWDPDTRRLAYGPNMMVPVDEIDRLITDEELAERRA